MWKHHNGGRHRHTIGAPWKPHMGVSETYVAPCSPANYTEFSPKVRASYQVYMNNANYVPGTWSSLITSTRRVHRLVVVLIFRVWRVWRPCGSRAGLGCNLYTMESFPPCTRTKTYSLHFYSYLKSVQQYCTCATRV